MSLPSACWHRTLELRFRKLWDGSPGSAAILHEYGTEGRECSRRVERGEPLVFLFFYEFARPETLDAPARQDCVFPPILAPFPRCRPSRHPPSFRLGGGRNRHGEPVSLEISCELSASYLDMAKVLTEGLRAGGRRLAVTEFACPIRCCGVARLKALSVERVGSSGTLGRPGTREFGGT